MSNSRRVVALALLAGIGAPISPVHAATPEPDADPYAAAGTIDARHYRLTTTLAMPRARAFARLTGPQRRQLDRLVDRSAIVIDAYATADRMLVLFPAAHPAASLELLLSDDRDRLYAFDVRRSRMVDLPPERLPDILDRSGPTAREDFEATLLDQPPPPARPPHRLVTHRLDVGFKYRPPGRRANRWAVRVALATTGAEAPLDHPAAHPLYHLALPLLCDYRGRLIYDTLRHRTPRPRRWVRVVTNETTAATPVRHITRAIDLGRIRLPRKRFAADRPGFGRARSIWSAAPRNHQRHAAKALTGLRRGKPGALAVTNASPFAAMVYIDGALVGWVAPHNAISIKGLSQGFYRVYAASPTGVRSWGPRDTHVPGPITLD